MSRPDLYPLLTRIEAPSDLRKLPETKLVPLAGELREFLIQTVSQMGGHFAAGLGTVELTVALHYVFDTPHDRLVWDVGHQAYPHKVLTGRRKRLQTIKHKGGLAPFPSRFESEYDTFGVGHSSTSISAAIGMALAAKSKGEKRRVVAVIGDGAITAGQAFEALNHAGALDANVLVILNDNDMSISENVGALSNYFARVLSGKTYAALREGGKKILRRMPTVWELARRSEEHFKGMVLPGTLFEEMGFNYFGPIDGHDLDMLVKTLTNLRDLEGPQFLHVVTRKGKGYAPAEADPIKWHGPGPFDPRGRHDLQGKDDGPGVLAGVRPVAVRHGRARSAHRRHHARDARRLRPGRVLEALSRPLFRRRHRRAARRDARGRHGLRRTAAGGRDLFDVPAARLRPVDPRRRAAGIAGGLCDRPRRTGRRRRRHAPGRVRPVIPALHPEHGGDGAGRRERMPADALHRGHARRTGRRALSARARPGRSAQSRR